MPIVRGQVSDAMLRALPPEVVRAALAPFVARERKERIVSVVERRLVGVTVLLERPYDPHNAAAVLRSCEAMGLSHVHIVPQGGSISWARAVTQSADKWLDVYLHDSIEAAIDCLQGWGFGVWAACPPPLGQPPAASSAYEVIDITKPTALLFGSECAGLSERAKRLADGSFQLPMYGFSESLNLSVSVALALRETVSRWRGRLGRAGDLPPTAQRRLIAAYLARSTDRAADLVLEHLRRQAA